MKSRSKIFLFITLNDGEKPKLRKNQYFNSLYLDINNKTRALKKEMGKKYLTLAPTDERENKPKKHEEIWNKVRDLIRSINCDLSLKKTWKLYGKIIFVKHYPQVSFDECCYEL